MKSRIFQLLIIREQNIKSLNLIASKADILMMFLYKDQLNNIIKLEVLQKHKPQQRHF